jgi:putative intracellular protease/amidase
MSKKILTVLSEWGYWGEELVGPLQAFDEAKYKVDFATPTGKRPVALTPSMDPTFKDPPLGKSVTSEEMARRTKEIDDPKNSRLDKPINLSELMPDYPYRSSSNFLREMEQYYTSLEVVREQLRKYDALLIVGGSGPIVDLANNHRVHDLILAFHAEGKPIGAECYGVACLAFARNIDDRKSIILGKHVTGHCKEYDYKDGTGFMDAETRDLLQVTRNGKNSILNVGPPPYPLEYILRDAVGPAGEFHGNFGRPLSVIVDYPFITARSTPDSKLAGDLLVQVLEKDLKRYGW